METKSFRFVGALLIAFLLCLPAVAQSAVSAVTQGSTVQLTATADGTPPFTYAWKKGTVALPDVTAVITLTAVTAANAGDYSVVISNAFGSATSPAVTLSIGQPPTNPKISVIQQVIAWVKSVLKRMFA